MVQLTNEMLKRYQKGLFRLLNVKNDPLWQGLIKSVSIRNRGEKDGPGRRELVVTFTKVYSFIDGEWKSINIPGEYIRYTCPLRDFGRMMVNLRRKPMREHLTGTEIVLFLGNNRIILYTPRGVRKISSYKY